MFVSLRGGAADWACMVPFCLQHKIHRLPVVDDEGKCVGIITRTDIFWALVGAWHMRSAPELHSCVLLRC